MVCETELWILSIQEFNRYTWIANPGESTEEYRTVRNQQNLLHLIAQLTTGS